MHHVGNSLIIGRHNINFDDNLDEVTTYKEYELHDFDENYFYNEWYASYDVNGDGCAIDFPLRMKSC